MDYDYSSYSNYSSPPPNPVVMLVMSVIWLLFAIVFIAASWKIFTKAGKPGWASIIPIYNAIVLMQIVQKPWPLLFLLFVPFINIIFSAVLAVWLAQAYGRSTLFGILLLWLFPIGYLILGFGSSAYALGKSQSPTKSEPQKPEPPPTAAPIKS